MRKHESEPTIPVSNNNANDVYAIKTVVTGSLELVFHEKRAPISILASLTAHRHETILAPGLIMTVLTRGTTSEPGRYFRF